MDSTMEFPCLFQGWSRLWMSRLQPGLSITDLQGRASILCCVLPPLLHR